MPNSKAKKELRHVWTVVSSNTVISQESNNLSIFDVFEQFAVQIVETPENPKPKKGKGIVLPHQYYITTLWQRDKNADYPDARGIIVFIDPIGKKITESIHSIKFKDNTTRLRVNTKNSALPLTVSGNYWFKVYLKKDDKSSKKLVAEIPLEVKIGWIKETKK